MYNHDKIISLKRTEVIYDFGTHLFNTHRTSYVVGSRCREARRLAPINSEVGGGRFTANGAESHYPFKTVRSKR